MIRAMEKKNLGNGIEIRIFTVLRPRGKHLH